MGRLPNNCLCYPRLETHFDTFHAVWAMVVSFFLSAFKRLIRKSELYRKKEKHRKRFTVQVATRTRAESEALAGSPTWIVGLRHWVLFCCFFPFLSWESDWKWRSWEFQLVPICDVGIPDVGFTHCVATAAPVVLILGCHSSHPLKCFLAYGLYFQYV